MDCGWPHALPVDLMPCQLAVNFSACFVEEFMSKFKKADCPAVGVGWFSWLAPGIIKGHLFGGHQTMHMYDKLEGFPINSALLGLVI